jgi:imidazolonepropionase-like amidohydrolase
MGKITITVKVIIADITVMRKSVKKQVAADTTLKKAVTAELMAREAAAAAGVDSVEHGAYQNEASLAAMAENGTVWVPTLSTIGNLRGTGRFPEKAVAQILDNAMENVLHYVNLGGIIAPGTDAGAWSVPHGSTTEYQLLRVPQNVYRNL